MANRGAEPDFSREIDAGGSFLDFDGTAVVLATAAAAAAAIFPRLPP